MLDTGYLIRRQSRIVETWSIEQKIFTLHRHDGEGEDEGQSYSIPLGGVRSKIVCINR